MGPSECLQVFKAPGPTFIPCTVARMIRKPYSHPKMQWPGKKAKSNHHQRKDVGQSDPVSHDYPICMVVCVVPLDPQLLSPSL